jgi:hypothetical protein
VAGAGVGKARDTNPAAIANAVTNEARVLLLTV